MTLRITRAATAAALAASLGLVALPACKKTKPPPPANTAPDANPNPNPNPGPGGRDSNAPSSPVFGAATSAPMRTAALENARQIGAALLAFHDANGAFPAGYATKDGKPGLSWRVAILPYIEQDNLFKQFKLDEPWDSPSNIRLKDSMPKLYAPPRQDTFGYTFYRGFTGPGAALEARQPMAKAGDLLKGVSFAQILDGTSNTIVAAEAYDPVIWTKPDELQYAPGKPPKLGGVLATGAVVLLADGSAKFVPNSTPPKTLEAAITVGGGEVVNWDN